MKADFLFQQPAEDILNAASLCHITRSIEEGMEIICSLAEFDDG
ncbi:MAG: hypothetical protein V3W45_02055 [Sedimentisphaerales bacterium]